MSTNRTALIIVLVVIAVVAAYFVLPAKQGSERSGTETLTAEEVVDLEVQAAAEYEAAGGTY